MNCVCCKRGLISSDIGPGLDFNKARPLCDPCMSVANIVDTAAFFLSGGTPNDPRKDLYNLFNRANQILILDPTIMNSEVKK